MDKDTALDLALEALSLTADRMKIQRDAITAIKQARALDKKAENARELGLDYEPVDWEAIAADQALTIALLKSEAAAQQEHEPENEPHVSLASVQEPVNWSVYNSGAEVASGLTFSEAWNYLTPERLAREWCAVCVVDQSNMPITSPAQPSTEESSAVAAPASWMEMVTANLVREGVNKHKASELAERFYSLAQKAVPLTDDQIRGLTPKPDGVAEGNVRRVEVLPGVMGTEFDEVDAWSMPLVLQIARAIEAAHGITPPGGLPS